MATARTSSKGTQTQDPSAILEVESLTLRLGGKPILQDIQLRIAAGELLLLIGPSGSGKSTLLRAVAGLETVTSGRISLLGTQLDDGAGNSVRPERRRMAMVFQDHALWPHLRVIENVALVIPGRDSQKQAMALLERMGIAALAQRRPHQISGGQRQRVGLARALAVEPALVLMDEPLSSLDVELREQLRMEILRWLQELGISALVVSHDPDDFWRLAHRVVALAHGKVVQVGSPKQLFQEPAIPWIARFTGALGPLPALSQGGYLYLGPLKLPFPGGDASPREGIVYYRPEGLRVAEQSQGTSPGVSARLLYQTFERGQFRGYWQVQGIAEPMISLGQEPCPPAATLLVDLAQIFFFSKQHLEEL
ncbi:MAG: ABC transporter ATP-binding protein [Acidithiobacillus sp.]|nr:ABC transporter ATP-binding protein [Acidithiobacillus sp.]